MCPVNGNRLAPYYMGPKHTYWRTVGVHWYTWLTLQEYRRDGTYLCIYNSLGNRSSAKSNNSVMIMIDGSVRQDGLIITTSCFLRLNVVQVLLSKAIMGPRLRVRRVFPLRISQ